VTPKKLLEIWGGFKIIKLNNPYIPDSSRDYANQSLSRPHQQGDGPFSEKSTAILSSMHNGSDVLLTPSCTHSLEMASMLVNLSAGDEVILPSFNFSSGATAIEKFGAVPVFVDIDPKTKCIDTDAALAAVTSRTKAVSWINYGGASPRIEDLQKLKKEFGLFLIEDNAHGLGGTYKGLPLGTFGDVSCLSFHATKNIQCGEGGALVINDSTLSDRARIIREKGTNRSRFVLGEIQKYEWVGPGSSYLMAEVLAAILLGQLEMFDEIHEDRVNSWERYYSYINEKKSNLFKLPYSDISKNRNLAHNFYLELRNEKERDILIKTLKRHEIEAAFHYQPLHRSPAGIKYSPYGQPLNNSESVALRILRLPLYFDLEGKLWEKLDQAMLEFEDSI
jgi:dTDP-4-amino-4,6-dideoxygalactose transaminase